MVTREDKKLIDEMTQEEMCRRWRFSPIDGSDLIFQGDTGKYFAEVLQRKGGFTPEISKRIGWRKP